MDDWLWFHSYCPRKQKVIFSSFKHILIFLLWLLTICNEITLRLFSSFGNFAEICRFSRDLLKLFSFSRFLLLILISNKYNISTLRPYSLYFTYMSFDKTVTSFRNSKSSSSAWLNYSFFNSYNSKLCFSISQVSNSVKCSPSRT